MRLVVGFVVVLAACSDKGSRSVDAGIDAGIDAFVDAAPEGPCEFEGRTYPGNVTWGDECNSCHCMGGTAYCTIIGCGGPNGDQGDSCAPSGACPNGPKCGGLCCDAGERCDGYSCVCSDASLLCGGVTRCTPPSAGACGTACVD